MTSPDGWSASSFPFFRRGLIRLGIAVSVQLRDSFFPSSLKNKRLLRNSLSVFCPFSRQYFLANVRIITLFYHLSPFPFLALRISGPLFISQIDRLEQLSPAPPRSACIICMVNTHFKQIHYHFPCREIEPSWRLLRSDMPTKPMQSNPSVCYRRIKPPVSFENRADGQVPDLGQRIRSPLIRKAFLYRIEDGIRLSCTDPGKKGTPPPFRLDSLLKAQDPYVGFYGKPEAALQVVCLIPDNAVATQANQPFFRSSIFSAPKNLTLFLHKRG